MADPVARAAAGVGDDERIVAVVNVGEPADVPPAKVAESRVELYELAALISVAG